MPAHGDQHKPNGATSTTTNPFEEARPHISEYTAIEIATLQSRLNKRLGPEYISTRAGPGGAKVAYLSAEKVINLANEVFGFNGWSSSIQNIQIDYVDENPQKGSVSLGLSVVVRVTLRDGTYHEDIGYGVMENCKSKGAAFEKAKKEGTTDALKRALRNFGNVLGNCIYDKDYIAKVSKVKAGTGKWDVNELYRHADFAPAKKEGELPAPTTNPATTVPSAPPTRLIPEDSFEVMDFDEADFDDIGNPDEVILPPDTTHSKGGGRQQISNINHQNTPSKPPQHRTDSNGIRPQPNQNTTNLGNQSSLHTRSEQVVQESAAGSRSSSPGIASQHFLPPPPPPAGPQVAAFFSARDADKLDGNNNPVNPAAVTKFNPHAESPSIRKTQGVDHSQSMALNRKTLKHEPLPKPPNEAITPVPVKISAPPTPQGIPNPMMRSTSAYRPPTRHGPSTTIANSGTTPNAGEGERVLTAAKRAPLGDVSNVASGPHGTMNGELSAKRPRVGPGLSGHTSLENAEPTSG